MPIRLDERLSYIASLIGGGSAADVGCDHGKLAYFLLSTEKVSKMIATDISENSLQKAISLARENGAEIDFRVGDGLKPLKSGEVDCVIIAGLGGDVIEGILDAALKEGKTFENFVISSNTHPEKVRLALLRCGHAIVFDRLVKCAGKLYSVIKSERSEIPQSLDECEILFGVGFESDELQLARIKEELAFQTELKKNNPGNEKISKRVELLENALKHQNRRFMQ